LPAHEHFGAVKALHRSTGTGASWSAIRRRQRTDGRSLQGDLVAARYECHEQ
jgi:hypothetical protein